jgi:hypothetical protein
MVIEPYIISCLAVLMFFRFVGGLGIFVKKLAFRVAVDV